MSRSAPPGEGAWCDRLLALPPPTVLYHATTPKKYGRMVATGFILPPVRGFTAEAGARTWAHEIDGHRPVILRLTLTGPAYPLPDHHNEDGWAFWSPAPAIVERLICPVGPDGQRFTAYVSRLPFGWRWDRDNHGKLSCGIGLGSEVDAVRDLCDRFGAHITETSSDFDIALDAPR